MLRDYPIGTCLFWDIDKETFDHYVFNKFIKCYNEISQREQRGERALTVRSEYSAVLDGQQRITSLYLGVVGKWSSCRKVKKDLVRFDKFLCIDILSAPQRDDDKYPFGFVEESLIGKVVENENGKKSFWKKVNDIFSDDDFDHADFMLQFNIDHNDILSSAELKLSAKMLRRLDNALKITKTVNYFPSKGKTLPEVVDIFVRVNSGGQKLAASDLMLSVASGNLDDRDVHSDMQKAIERINSFERNGDCGSKIDQELILMSGLLFTDAESLSMQKTENYSRETMAKIFDAWDKIIEALANAVRCIEYVGFSIKKLSSKSIIMPIAYYYYKNNLNSTYISSTKAKCDRVFIRQWMLRSILAEVFSDGIGATLINIKKVIAESNAKYFPLDDLMKRAIKRDLCILDKVDKICDLRYGDVKVLPVLLELAKFSQPDEYQVDHIWAKELMKKNCIRNHYKASTDEEIKSFIECSQKLANLELLKAQVNSSKSDELYEKWLEKEKPKEHYFEENCIPRDRDTYAFRNFLKFFDAREKIIRERLRKAFPDSFAEIVEMHGLDVR